MTTTRRSALLGLAGLPLLGASPAAAQAEASYPSRTIRLVVPYAAGGAVDLTARLFAQKLGERLGQAVVVDNRSGANGIVGADSVSKAPADGYTLLIAPREVFGVNPGLYPSLPYDPRRSFAYIGIVATAAYAIVVNPSLGVTTFPQFLERARRSELNYASFGNGSMPQLNIEAMNRQLGLRMNHVAYRGSAPAVTALVAGEVDMTISTPPPILGFVRQGRLRALAVGSERRLPQLPDVPTMTELGITDDPLIPVFFGIAAPAGTPAPIVAKLNAELRAVAALPDVSERLEAAGVVPAVGTPEAMTETVGRDIERFAAIIRAANIRAD
jgi:tripartite-type tricarboxylate transporter receptor subunit TctC